MVRIVVGSHEIEVHCIRAEATKSKLRFLPPTPPPNPHLLPLSVLTWAYFSFLLFFLRLSSLFLLGPTGVAARLPQCTLTEGYASPSFTRRGRTSSTSR